mgnify:CR=1 FL=1
MKKALFSSLLACLIAGGAMAQTAPEEEEYFGSEAVADGKGSVAVKVVYFANEKCWQIKDAREGVPDVEADQPTGRNLYVTVNIEKKGSDCSLTSVPIKTALSVPDKKGKISLDIFFVDERGVVTRSQRHRIQRDSCTESC